jgi:hypothetical protein
MICEPDDLKNEAAKPDVEEFKEDQGGYGRIHPQVRKENLKFRPI